MRLLFVWIIMKMFNTRLTMHKPCYVIFKLATLIELFKMQVLIIINTLK